MSKGFFTIAQGDLYVRAAYALALSLKVSQSGPSNLSIGITPGYEIPEHYKAVFDKIIEIPWKDHAADSDWKRENEWKSIYMSPYDETIKLDADMLFTNDISHWWETLSHSDGVFATQTMTYRNALAQGDFYRKTFTDNKLPNVYTAFFYFKKTERVFELFQLAEIIFNNWERYYNEFLEAKSRPPKVSADVVFALAAKIVNFEEANARPHLNIPTFVHMKTRLQGWEDAVEENWMELVPTYFTPDCVCKIGNYIQTYPLHYYQKHFLTDEMIQFLEKKAGV